MAIASENAAGTVVILTMDIDEATYLCDLLGSLSGDDPYSEQMFNTLSDCESIDWEENVNTGARHFEVDKYGNFIFGEQNG